jgi:hypothetical protein
MIIDVAPDRSRAWVRGRSTMQAGLHETAKGNQRQWWEGGVYENQYLARGRRLEAGAPRLLPALARELCRRLGENADRLHTDGEEALSRRPRSVPMPSSNRDQRLWPATDIVPFHYVHPVTGKPIKIDNSRAREGFTSHDW